MKVIEGHRPFRLEDGDGGHWVANASPHHVAMILAADENSSDGRSQWVYIRLPNGDLVLAVYPQGETYFATEDDRTI